jgi:hypothetical protein
MKEGGRGGGIMSMEERGSGRGSVETEEWKNGRVDEWNSPRVEKSRTGSGRIQDCWSGRVEVEEIVKQQRREYGQCRRE